MLAIGFQSGETPGGIPTEDECKFLGTHKSRGIGKCAHAHRFYSTPNPQAWLFGKEYAAVVSGEPCDFAYVASVRSYAAHLLASGKWATRYALTGEAPTREEIDAVAAIVTRAEADLRALVDGFARE
jgi:hypothetical protein